MNFGTFWECVDTVSSEKCYEVSSEECEAYRSQSMFCLKSDERMVNFLDDDLDGE